MIAQYLFRNPSILVLVVLAIIVAGASSIVVMPRLEDPVLSRRVGVVSTAFPGANAQRVESLVAIPYEEHLADIEQIKQVRSNSQTGVCNLMIELKDEVKDVEPVWTIIRDRISDVQQSLPAKCVSSELDVLRLQAYAAVIALKGVGDGSPELKLLRKLARQLSTELLALPGTAKVVTFGDPGEEYMVELSPMRLAGLGLSTAAIAAQIRDSNSEQPAGRIANEYSMVPLALSEASTPMEALGAVEIAYGGSAEPIELSQIANIQKRLVHPRPNATIIDGQAAIVLGVFADDDLRIDQWTTRLREELERFGQSYEDALEIDLLFSQSEHVNRRMQQLQRNLGVGTLAVMSVVLLMMGWRSMLVVGLALPLSASMVFFAMRLLSIPIHQISVTGLIVALGLLIDNAIVMVEEVRQRMVAGCQASQAIRQSVRHLAMPLFGSTLTTALAFVPIATLPGPPGEFVGTIAISVILAICSSFILSMTVIPAIVSLFGHRTPHRGILNYGLSIDFVQRIYEATLAIVYRFPLLGLVLGLVLPAIGFLGIPQLPLQFFPPSDRAQIRIDLERPARDSTAATLESVAQVRGLLDSYSEVERQYWFVGGSAPTFYYNVVPRRRNTPFFAQAIIDVAEGADPDSLVRRLQSDIDQQCASARVIVRQLEQGPPFDAPIEVRLSGPDLGTLQELGRDVRTVLANTANVIHTRCDLDETIPRFSLGVDLAAAKAAGLNHTQIAGQLYTLLEGADAGSVYQAGEEIPVRVKLDSEGIRDIERVAALPLVSATAPTPSAGPTSANGLPPRQPPQAPALMDLATLQLESDVGAIIRQNGKRTNEIMGYIHAGILPSTVEADFRTRLQAANFRLPAGYSLQFGGEAEQRSQAIQRLIANGMVLSVMMLLTLVASFRSFGCAFIVACVGAMSVGLGPLALTVFGYPFGFMAIVGTMGLVGIAINDSIVVLAAIRSSPEAMAGDRTVLVEVVSSCTRHILATTATTIVGFTPLILSGGAFWPPLAVSIAGGVGGATVLALYFVPAMHQLVMRRPATV